MKIYWRIVGDKYHAFYRVKTGGYDSLCGRWHRGTVLEGQRLNRPHTQLRCGRCDGLEMDRHGWPESGPATIKPKG